MGVFSILGRNFGSNPVLDEITVIRNILLQKIMSECAAIKPFNRQYSFPKCAGVYFVFEANDGDYYYPFNLTTWSLVYIGQTTDLSLRLSGRGFAEGAIFLWKNLDRANFCDLVHEEAAYIAFLAPRDNQRGWFRLTNRRGESVKEKS